MFFVFVQVQQCSFCLSRSISSVLCVCAGPTMFILFVQVHQQYSLCLCRSNKGASKQRRDQINAEIATMRDLLPLPETARQRLSQLQIMSLSCVYIRKCNVLQKCEWCSSSRLQSLVFSCSCIFVSCVCPDDYCVSVCACARERERERDGVVSIDSLCKMGVIIDRGQYLTGWTRAAWAMQSVVLMQ